MKHLEQYTMKNNGQVLALFVIILPIILLIVLITIEFGKLYVEKIKTTNVIKETITYGLKNIEDTNIKEKINNLIDINIKNINNKTIFISEDEIRIKLNQNKIKVFGKDIVLEYNYKGIKKEQKIIIEEG